MRILLTLFLLTNASAVAHTQAPAPKQTILKKHCIEAARSFAEQFAIKKFCFGQFQTSYNVSPNFNNIYLYNAQLLLAITDNFAEPKKAFWFSYNISTMEGQLVNHHYAAKLLAQAKK